MNTFVHYVNIALVLTSSTGSLPAQSDRAPSSAWASINDVAEYGIDPRRSGGAHGRTEGLTKKE